MSYFKLVAKSPRFGFNICKNMVLLWYLLSFNLTDENTGNHQYKLVETSVWRQAADSSDAPYRLQTKAFVLLYAADIVMSRNLNGSPGWLTGWMDRSDQSAPSTRKLPNSPIHIILHYFCLHSIAIAVFSFQTHTQVQSCFLWRHRY